MSFQNITILGRVGAAAELRFTPSGTAVAGFSLASNETWKDSNGTKQERVTWHRCTLWGKAAESLAEYITKGKMIMVTGTVTARAYAGKDGNPAASLEVKVEQLRFAGGNGGDSGNHADPTDSIGVDNASEIPF